MIVTEAGLHFRREGTRWCCLEHPELEMLPGSGLYVLAGEDDLTFFDARDAIKRIEGGPRPK